MYDIESMRKEITMKKTVLFITYAIVLSAGIIGCGNTSDVKEIASEEALIESAPEETVKEPAEEEPSEGATETSREWETAICTIIDVSDDIIALEGTESDTIYQTPISNYKCGEINPDDKYIISFRIKDKIELEENVYYIENCDLCSLRLLTEPECEF